jgi:hypothetical protein
MIDDKRILTMAKTLPDCLSTEKKNVEKSGFIDPTLTALVNALVKRAHECWRRISMNSGS